MRRRSFLGDAILPGALAGALAGILVGTGETIELAFSKGSIQDLSALPYATILYGGMALLAGAGLGFCLFVLGRKQNPDALAQSTSRWSFALALAGMTTILARFRIMRDVFESRMRTLSLTGLLFHLGLLVAALILVSVVLWLARRIQRSRSGRFAVRVLPLLLILMLVGGSFLTATLVRPRRDWSPNGSIPPGLQDKPNVILIVVDTLRADHLSCYGYPEATSPQIDTLADDGVLYTEMRAQASWTRPSIATVLTSLYPSSHTAVKKTDKLPQGVISVAEVLQEAGYSTGGFADNINIAPSFGFDQGFGDYVFLEPSYPLGATAASSQLAFYKQLRIIYFKLVGERLSAQHFYQDAATVNKVALDWLETYQRDRFFLFLHYMDPHDPYMEHPYTGLGYARVRNENPKAAMAPVFAELYDGEIRFLDQYLGELFAWLKQAGLYEDTLIILTADHGEEFYEHQGWWHGQTLYGEQIRVPLIIKYPQGEGEAKEERSFARSLDIAPTILEVAGLAIPDIWQGMSLRGNAEGVDWLFAEESHQGNFVRSIEHGSHKLILANPDNPRGLPPVALFDISADPDEQHNLALEQGDRVTELRRLLESAQDQAGSERVAGETGSFDPAAEEQLQNLGY
jgi:arylsulfatase A-like enzyme